MMNKKSLKNDKRAVSPVIGVILMVAITVILAAVIAAFVFGISPSAESAPNAQLRPTVTASDEMLTLKHMGGEPVALDDCTVRVDNTAVTFDTGTNLTVGQTSPKSTPGPGCDVGDAVSVEVIHNPSQSYLLDTTITAVA